MEVLNKYADWVRSSPETARHAEDITRLLAMAVPSTIGEVAYAATNVFTLVNDSILVNVSRLGETQGSRQARTMLSVLAGVDVLIELLSLKLGGRAARNRVIVLLELLRAVCKMYVFVSSPERIQHMGGQATAAPPGGHKDASGEGGSLLGAMGLARDDRAPQGVWRAGLTGMTIPLPPDYNKDGMRGGVGCAQGGESTAPPAWHSSRIASTLMQGIRCVAANAVSHPSERRVHSSPPTGGDSCAMPAGYLAPGGVGSGACVEESEAAPLRVLGEVLYILRPLIYVASRSVFGGRSWLPLLVSAAVDATSARCTYVSADRATGGSEPFLPHHFLQALNASSARVRTHLQSLTRRVASTTDSERGVSEAPSSLLSSSGITAGSSKPVIKELPFAFSRSAGQADGALSSVLGTQQAGVTGLLVRFGLWCVQSLPGLNEQENAEIQRRRLLLLMYLLRSPAFHVVTNPAAGLLVGSAGWIPLLGSLLRYGRDILVYLNAHHFYTSASQ